MKTIEITGDEPVLERAKKYKIPLKFPAKRETTELPIQERDIRVRHNLPIGDGGPKMYIVPEEALLTQEEREILYGR